MRVAVAVGLVVALTASCTYLKYASIQAEYARLQEAAPSQRNLKHLIERSNFAVIGRISDPDGLYTRGVATITIAAFSSQFRGNELVDVMQDITVGTHFGLDLPEGEFELVALMDINGNGVYSSEEVVGRRSLTLSAVDAPSSVVNHLVVELAPVSRIPWPIDLEVEVSGERAPSLFFPAGTIRDLSDPIFSDEMTTLGLYDPATFFARASTLFYALEEDLAYKIPVIFVHGAAGSARGFEEMLLRLDRSRFKPWFFHYPSGGDLDQLGELFYDIFLSGQTIPRNDFVPTVVVAHSMGGLVVRKALNQLDGDSREPNAIKFISLATPFGGHPSAVDVDDIPLMILPSWRDMNPEGQFLRELYTRRLPGSVTHFLFYAFNNKSFTKLGENSDGVVPLSSQLHSAAQQQSSRQRGIDTSHDGIQRERPGIDAVMQVLEGIENEIPVTHMLRLRAGGFEAVGDYSALERYILRHYGCLLAGFARDELKPLSLGQRQLIPMLRGEAVPAVPAAVAWSKFRANDLGERHNKHCIRKQRRARGSPVSKGK